MAWFNFKVDVVELSDCILRLTTQILNQKQNMQEALDLEGGRKSEKMSRLQEYGQYRGRNI